MKVMFFTSQYAFRKWLEKNYHKETELYVGFYSERSGKSLMSLSQSVNQALSFGWIDSDRKSIDEESYCIRFTPREMSNVRRELDINKMKVLCETGLKHKAGLQSFNSLKETKPVVKKEPPPSGFSKKYIELFRSNEAAWKYFSQQSEIYKKITMRWIMDSKQPKRLSRLEELIFESENHRRICFM